MIYGFTGSRFEFPIKRAHIDFWPIGFRKCVRGPTEVNPQPPCNVVVAWKVKFCTFVSGFLKPCSFLEPYITCTQLYAFFGERKTIWCENVDAKRSRNASIYTRKRLRRDSGGAHGRSSGWWERYTRILAVPHVHSDIFRGVSQAFRRYSCKISDPPYVFLNFHGEITTIETAHRRWVKRLSNFQARCQLWSLKWSTTIVSFVASALAPRSTASMCGSTSVHDFPGFLKLTFGPEVPILGKLAWEVNYNYGTSLL